MAINYEIVDEIYICESHRGKGLGAEVIKFFEATCHGLEVQALHLEVERANTKA
jgi:hypothetical protein